MKLYVLTCPREHAPGGASYLARLLVSLDQETWAGPRTLWSDGPLAEDVVGTMTREGAARWRVVERPRRGPPNALAYWDLLADAARDDRDALVLEDDLAVSPGILPYANHLGCPPPLSYLSLFDPICARTSEVPSVVMIPAARAISCQARLWPARTMRKLVGLGPGPHPERGASECLAAALTGTIAAVHVPSACQHVGYVSAIDPTVPLVESRVSRSWLGREVDLVGAFGHLPARDIYGFPLPPRSLIR